MDPRFTLGLPSEQLGSQWESSQSWTKPHPTGVHVSLELVPAVGLENSKYREVAGAVGWMAGSKEESCRPGWTPIFGCHQDAGVFP